MERLRGRRSCRPPLCFCGPLVLIVAVGLVATPTGAQEVAAWQVHPQGNFLIYVVNGTPGARDAGQIGTELGRLYTQVLAPLQLPPATILYPLYPSRDRFQQDWWQFALGGYGDIVQGDLIQGDVVHAWGTVYDGRPGRVSPYVVTRATVAHAFPRTIPLLKWGLADALGDRVVGIDSHRGVRALLSVGVPIPALRAIASPFAFGQALPASYPVAVSFVAFLLDRYGLARTAAFVNEVAYRYYDFPALLEKHFATSLEAEERRWRQRFTDGEGPRVDAQRYLRSLEFVYRTTLATDPRRTMLRPEGAAVLSEAFEAIAPLRALDLPAVEAHQRAVRTAEAAAQRQRQLVAFAIRGAFWLLILAPIALAVGWLMWPSIRARLWGGGPQPPVGGRSWSRK